MPFYPIALLATEKANNHRPATPVAGAGSHTIRHRHSELYQAHVNLGRWFKAFLILEQSPGPTRRLRTHPLTRRLTMPNGDIACLLKFAPKEAYIDGLMDGRLKMNAADYCHGLLG